VTNSLYHKNLDNDFGVVHYLMDALEEQEFKEAVLGYCFLSQAETSGMSENDLDECCEKFLKDEFGAEVNFEVKDALDKLLRDQLVTQSADQYSAVPLSEALRRLDHKWDNYFQFNVDENGN
jgi:hypothetical protein